MQGLITYCKWAKDCDVLSWEISLSGQDGIILTYWFDEVYDCVLYCKTGNVGVILNWYFLAISQIHQLNMIVNICQSAMYKNLIYNPAITAS